MDTPDKQIASCRVLLQRVLGPELLGLYLYGSATFGGLQRYSDLDFFAVTARGITEVERETIGEAVMRLSGRYRSTTHPIELTMVVLGEVNPWRYPPRFDFQYGDWLYDTYAIGDMQARNDGLMPDLALLITQVLLASRTLHGPDASTLLAPVPPADVLRAITDGLSSLRADLVPDTRNVLLTLARIWLTVETGAIGSKPHAAGWAIARLPPDLQPALQRALDATIGETPDAWDDLMPEAAATADAMLAEIARPRPVPPVLTLAR